MLKRRASEMTAKFLLFSTAHKSGWGVEVLGSLLQGLNTDHIKIKKKMSGYKWNTFGVSRPEYRELQRRK